MQFAELTDVVEQPITCMGNVHDHCKGHDQDLQICNCLALSLCDIELLSRIAGTCNWCSQCLSTAAPDLYLSRHPFHRAPLDQEAHGSRSPCRLAQTAHSCSNPAGGGPEPTCQAWSLLQSGASAQGVSEPSHLGQRKHPSLPACAATQD